MSLLQSDAEKVQLHARKLHQHLISVKQNSQNYFEAEFVNQTDLMAELDRLATAAVPHVLWRNQGAYGKLYRFLAPRFLANGDSAVPVERIHALWERLEAEKPGMSLVMLNSLLKIQFRTLN